MYLSNAMQPEQAQVKFDELTLDSFPGEDVTELATKALLTDPYFVWIVCVLPLNLDTKLIKKVTKILIEFFNRKMFTLLDNARPLETKYRLLLDHKLLGSDKDYTSFGPYDVCSTTLQEEHSILIADSKWPELATKIPKSNSTLLQNTPKAPDMRCYKCHEWGHKANDPICLLYDHKRGLVKHTTGMADKHVPTKFSSKLKPKDPWKYAEPKDLTQPVMVYGEKWCYCTKCRCRATGQQVTTSYLTPMPLMTPTGVLRVI